MGRNFEFVLLVLLLSLTITQVCLAGNISKSGISSNGKYRLEGMRPDDSDFARSYDKMKDAERLGSEKGDFLREKAEGSMDRYVKKGFTYVLKDLQAGKILWKRKQLESEGSCDSLYVNDDARSVICTQSNEIIIVDPQGKDIGKVDLTKEAFTEEEKKKYESDRLNRLKLSLCYFHNDDASKRQVFVTRFWWGKRVAVDLQSAKMLQADAALSSALEKKERAYVLWVLESGVKARQNWERKQGSEEEKLVQKAAFLAGKMRMKETIPLLRKLEDVKCISLNCFHESATTDSYRPQKDKVHPGYFSIYGIRQAIALSLRCFGEKPVGYDCFQFYEYEGEYKKGNPYFILPLKKPREQQVSLIKEGLKPEEILVLLGTPDYAQRNTWYYEISDREPFTLYFSWGKQGVSNIQKIKPPLWKSEGADQLVLDGFR